MATLTIADLDNGKRDLQTIDEVANSRLDTTTTRFGSQTLTLSGALRRLGYNAPVPYAPGLSVDSPLFTVEYGSPPVIYAPSPSLVPFTSGTWDPSQWRPIQNLNSDRNLLWFETRVEADLASPTLPDGQAVIVEEDKAIFLVQAGVLEFYQDLPLAALAKISGAGLVGYDGAEAYPAGSIGSALKSTTALSENNKSRLDTLGPHPRASIVAKNTGSHRYDVATIVCPAELMVIHTKQQSPGSPIMTRQSVIDFAADVGVPIATNCVPFRNADGSAGAGNATLVPDGILIANNQVIAGWDSALDPNRNQACALMPDGNLARFYSYTHSAQQIADAGALWAFSWGAWCLWDGVVPEDYPTSPLGGGTVASGRTILGQRQNGEFVIISVEGVTGQYGATPAQCSQIALDNNLYRAFVGDGGGSTQLVWSGAYANPSSDPTFRTLPAILGFHILAPQPYDSGVITLTPAAWVTGTISSLLPAISLRQIGANVSMTFNAAGFPSSASSPIVGNIPGRYRPETSSQGRGIGLGLGGGKFAWFMGQDSASQKPNGVLTVAKPDGDTISATGISGQVVWTQRKY